MIQKINEDIQKLNSFSLFSTKTFLFKIINEYKIILITKATPKITDKEISIGIQIPWTWSRRYMVVPATITKKEIKQIIERMIPNIENMYNFFLFISLIINYFFILKIIFTTLGIF